MPQPRFGFSVAPGEPRGVGREVAEAEALGYDRVGIWDSPALFRDPWVTLAAVARETSRIRLGTWVTNPLTRHPVVTASAAATLDDLAPGRAYIGIGSGDTGVSHLGGVPAPLARLRDYVLALRRLLEDGAAEYEGQTVRLEWARRRIPILVAAHGPRLLRLAGAIADGVIVGLGITPEVIRGSLELIEQGAHEAGRDLDDLEVWFTCHWSVDKGHDASQRVAAVVASFASHVARTGVEGKFVPDEYREGLLTLGAAYDKVTHGAVSPEQLESYAELAERLGVAEYVRRRFALAGTPGEVAEAIREAMQAGATNFDGAIDAPLAEHRQRIAAWASAILSQFGGHAASRSAVEGSHAIDPSTSGQSHIEFYSAKGPYGCFSNFAAYPFELGGLRWPTTEHYFQAQKFAGTTHEEQIRLTHSPMVAARMGRSRPRPLRRDWESAKDGIMLDGLRAKFAQHADIRAVLLATGDAEIVEHTSKDRHWGDGGDGSGANMLGRLLMQIRDELRSSSPNT